MKRAREMEREGERERGVLCKGEAGRLNIADSLGWWGRGAGGFHFFGCMPLTFLPSSQWEFLCLEPFLSPQIEGEKK